MNDFTDIIFIEKKTILILNYRKVLMDKLDGVTSYANIFWGISVEISQ